GGRHLTGVHAGLHLRLGGHRRRGGLVAADRLGRLALRRLGADDEPLRVVGLGLLGRGRRHASPWRLGRLLRGRQPGVGRRHETAERVRRRRGPRGVRLLGGLLLRGGLAVGGGRVEAHTLGREHRGGLVGHVLLRLGGRGLFLGHGAAEHRGALLLGAAGSGLLGGGLRRRGRLLHGRVVGGRGRRNVDVGRGGGREGLRGAFVDRLGLGGRLRPLLCGGLGGRLGRFGGGLGGLLGLRPGRRLGLGLLGRGLGWRIGDLGGLGNGGRLGVGRFG